MATGGDWTLDDSTVARLAHHISTKHMVTIAESYMKISHTTIENIKHENREAEAINREIIGTWRNSYSGPDQRLVSEFFKAFVFYFILLHVKRLRILDHS